MVSDMVSLPSLPSFPGPTGQSPAEPSPTGRERKGEERGGPEIWQGQTLARVGALLFLAWCTHITYLINHMTNLINHVTILLQVIMELN